MKIEEVIGKTLREAKHGASLEHLHCKSCETFCCHCELCDCCSEKIEAAPILARVLDEAIQQIRYLINCECGHEATTGLCCSLGDAKDWLKKHEIEVKP